MMLVKVVGDDDRQIRRGDTVKRRFLDGSIGPDLGVVASVGGEVEVTIAPDSTAWFATERVGPLRCCCPHLIVAKDEATSSSPEPPKRKEQ
jgi:hypothetical protein